MHRWWVKDRLFLNQFITIWIVREDYKVARVNHFLSVTPECKVCTHKSLLQLKPVWITQARKLRSRIVGLWNILRLANGDEAIIELVEFLFIGIWQLGDVACSMYLFLDVGLCTSSILHMCTISFDRYLGIAYPLKYSNFRWVCNLVLYPTSPESATVHISTVQL